jgi:tetraacyldisaccharide 4'-kinase
MNPISFLYLQLLKLHRKIKKPKNLPCPVISVGNIAVGGRGKTPMVISIVKILNEKGYHPVVLTRGYRREIKNPVWILPDQKNQDLSAEKCGDEALEIFLKSRTTVLIGHKRFSNAMTYLTRYPELLPKVVFVLDDGFQHWEIKRDLNLVLVTRSDLETEKILPFGRLREPPSALSRATQVLVLNEDFKKTTAIPKLKSSDKSVVAITTRAEPTRYLEEIKESYKKLFFYALRDHASMNEMLSLLDKIHEGGLLLLGWKEIVKILTSHDLSLLAGGQESFELLVGGQIWEVLLVDYELTFLKPEKLDLLKSNISQILPQI